MDAACAVTFGRGILFKKEAAVQDLTPTAQFVATSALDIAYEEWGPPGGMSALLLHGFPYDVRSFDEVAVALASAGFRTIVPYLRGFGPTRFRSQAAPRLADQATLARDVLDLSDALGLERPILAGFDWGGRAACAAAALWPTRFRALVAIGGYTIYNVENATVPAPARVEQVLWYQYYLHTERGRRGLMRDRRAFARLLWSDWSPRWTFDENVFDTTAQSFDNPDFVEIVLHSYRHRFGLVPGDPALAELDARLRDAPPIEIPTVVLQSGSAPLPPPGPDSAAPFANLYASRTIEHAGHHLPAEAPAAVVTAVLELAERDAQLTARLN